MAMLPKPNVDVRLSGDKREWTPDQVRGLLCNPIYAGNHVSDAEWIAAAEKMIVKEGAAQFLVNMLYALRASGVMQEKPSPGAN